MHTFLTVFQIIVTILLIISILTQNRSSGLSATFGGSGDFYVEKRGPEKVLYRATVILSILFVGSSIAFVFI